MLRNSGQTHLSVPRVAESGTLPGDLLAAVRQAAGREFELLAELGRNDAGSVAYLARDSRHDRLAALALRKEGREPDGSERFSLTVLNKLGGSVPAGHMPCLACGVAQAVWTRFCERCGADVSGVSPTARAGSRPEEISAAVGRAAEGEYAILGEMERAQGGGRVYFARELESRRLVALRLQAEPESADDARFSLGVIQTLQPLLESSPGGHSTPARAMRALGIEPPAPRVRDVNEIRATALQSEAVRHARDVASRRRLARRPKMIAFTLLPASLLAAAVLFALTDRPLIWQTSGGNTEREANVRSERGVTRVEGRPISRPDSGILRIGRRLPAKSRLTVDAIQFRGSVVTLKAGRHVVTVTAPGYQPFSKDVVIAARETLVVRPRLIQIVPAADSAAAPDTDVPQAPSPIVVATPEIVSRPVEAASARSCGVLFQRQEWADALGACEREAAAGAVAAQFRLARIHDQGLGRRADAAIASVWFHKAAMAGSSEAQYQLALMYETGRGVRKDRAQSVDWLRKAATGGDLDAQVKLATAYERGKGVDESGVDAAFWYRKAAEQGNVWAQNRLAVLLSEGKKISRNEVEAVSWFLAAAERGDANAQFSLARMYASGRGVAQSDSAAAYWFRKASDQGHRGAGKELWKRGMAPP